VDEAWHLHLCYTRSYWEGLCGEVLGRQLHHGPTRGGAKEDGKFEEWYERTLASYRSVFGQEPPADVWPTSRVRFGPNPWTKVNTQDCWVVRKSAVAWSAAAAIPLGLLVGCSGSGDQSLGIFVFGSIFLLVMLANLASGRRRRGRRFRSRRRKGSGCGSSGCGSSGCGSSGCGSSGCGSSGCGSSGCGSSGCGSSGCGGGGGGD
jgi:hypothetical protein